MTAHSNWPGSGGIAGRRPGASAGLWIALALFLCSGLLVIVTTCVIMNGGASSGRGAEPARSGPGGFGPEYEARPVLAEPLSSRWSEWHAAAAPGSCREDHCACCGRLAYSPGVTPLPASAAAWQPGGNCRSHCPASSFPGKIEHDVYLP